MTIHQLLEAIFTGQRTLKDLDQWVTRNRSLYRKPRLPEAGSDSAEFDRLIDEYSDYEIRANELGRLIQGLQQQAFAKTAQNSQCAKIVYSLSRCFEEIPKRAMGAFCLGYVLWQTNEYFDAAEMLREAADLFGQCGVDPLVEVTALSYRCDCLRNHKQFDDTIQCADDLIQRAKRYGFRGHEALALRDRGMAQAALGRQRESLDSLNQSVTLRRSLSPKEVEEQTVIEIPAFLNELGITARKFGYYEDALKAFLECVEIHQREGNIQLGALALSEVGYTYHSAGNNNNAAEFLKRAAALESRRGRTAEFERWSMQARALAAQQNSMDDDDEPPFHPVVSPVPEASEETSAQLQVERAHVLFKQGKPQNALTLASDALKRALLERDSHLQIVCRNLLALCHSRLERLPEAISEFHKAIQLADSVGGTALSLSLRYNLAKLFLQQSKYEKALAVLDGGIAFSQMAFQRADSFALRQQVIAGSLPLYELYSLLLSSVTQNGHHRLLILAETVRARHMANWARLLSHVSTSSIPRSIREKIESTVQQLRAVEVELDLHHSTRSLTSSVAADLQTKTMRIHEDISQTVRKLGIPFDSFDQPSYSDEELDAILESLITPELAVISLFSVPEGVCPVVVYREGNQIKTAGKFLSWNRNERLRTISEWTCHTGRMRSRSMGDRGLGGDPGNAVEPSQRLKELLSAADKHLFGDLLKILHQVRPKRLAVIPHRELAMIPFWRLVDGCKSIEEMTIVPNLNFLRICTARQRSTSGPTFIVPDVTQTLPQAKFELETVRRNRTKGNLPHVHAISSVDQLISKGAQCNLLHIVAHGAFNPGNAYHSGFLVGGDEKVPGLVSQYARLVSQRGGHRFEFSSIPEKGSFRLATVADCMARLSLSACRLAVLSACECGQVDSHGGGELAGLPTSLLVAGAQSVVAALWPVDDSATALLMYHFYRIWEGGAGSVANPARALSLARRRLASMRADEIRVLLGPSVELPEGEHPFSSRIFCDAFQCFGDW